MPSTFLSSLARVFRTGITFPSSTISSATTTTRLGLGLSSTTTTNALLRQPFSATASQQKKKAERVRLDKRIRFIRYFLSHPKTPRPLRFSRNRYLRHWTIHRAWNLYRATQRTSRSLELERMQNSMSAACEELRMGAGDGGRLFRKSMNKKGVFRDGFPIEYSKGLVDSPGKEGWNHGWKRQ